MTTFTELRRSKGFETQDALSLASGLSLATIKNIERGVIGDLKVSTLDAIATALVVERDELLRALGVPSPHDRKATKRARRRTPTRSTG